MYRPLLATFAAVIAVTAMLTVLTATSSASTPPSSSRQGRPAISSQGFKDRIHRAQRVRGRAHKMRRKVVRRRRRAISRHSVGKALALHSTAASASSSDLLFRGAKVSDFWVNHSAPGAITEVADPTGSDESAFQMTVGDQDVYPITPTENPRAELLSTPIVEPEDELWWSAKFYLPADFPASVPGWLTVLEGPYGPPFNGTPPWQIAVEGDHIEWSRNSTYGWDVPWQMPLVRGSWVSVMVHEKFGTEGWVEMWIDGQQVTFFAGDTYNPEHVGATSRLAMETMDFSNSGGANSIYLMSYRKAGMFNSATVDQGPLSIGTTRASVES